MAKLPINDGTDYVYVDDDLERELDGKAWRLSGNGKNVYRNYREDGRVRTQSLASAVMEYDLEKGEVWQHLDGDWRNFCRGNLRVVQRGSNLHSDPERLRHWGEKGRAVIKEKGAIRPVGATGYRGVHRYLGKYRAVTTIDGKQKFLGTRATAAEAAILYDDMMVQLGKSRVNFPDGKTPTHSPTFQERVEQIRASGDRASLKSMLAGKLSARQRKVLLELAAEFL